MQPNRKITPEVLARARESVSRNLRDTGKPHYRRVAFEAGVSSSAMHAALNPAPRGPEPQAADPVDCHYCGKPLEGHPRCVNASCGRLIHEGPMQARYRCGCGVAHVHGKDGLCNSCYGKRPTGYEHSAEELAWQYGTSAREMAREVRRLRAVAASRAVQLPAARGVPSAAAYVDAQIARAASAIGNLPELGGRRAALQEGLADYAKRV